MSDRGSATNAASGKTAVEARKGRADTQVCPYEDRYADEASEQRRKRTTERGAGGDSPAPLSVVSA
jgi:hypothetical protein